MEALPGVPTFQELGMKFYPRIDRGVAVPKATPADITAKLEKAFLDTVNQDDYKSKIMKAGFVPLALNSQQSIKYITEQTEIFKKTSDRAQPAVEKIVSFPVSGKGDFALPAPPLRKYKAAALPSLASTLAGTFASRAAFPPPGPGLRLKIPCRK